MTKIAENPLKVVHTMPDRVRLRISDSSKAKADSLSDLLDTITQELQQQEGVYNVEANSQAGSLVVNFDQNTLSLSQLLEKLQESGVIASSALPSEADQTEALAALRSGEFWQEQLISILPIAAGLLLIRALKIQGLWTIPVYIIAASFTRKLLEQIEYDAIAAVNSAAAPSHHTESNQNGHRKNQSVDRHPPTPPQTIAVAQPNPVQSSPNKSLEPAIAYSIVHQIPGRLRVKVSKITKDSKYARRLEQLVEAEPWVTNIRLNPTAASVVVTYEQSIYTVSEAVSHLLNLIQAASADTVAISTLSVTEAPRETVTIEESTTDLAEASQQEEVAAIAPTFPLKEVSDTTPSISVITEATEDESNPEEPSILAPAIAKFCSWLKQFFAITIADLPDAYFKPNPRESPNSA
jgi:copper chaperone CopZ